MKFPQFSAPNVVPLSRWEPGPILPCAAIPNPKGFSIIGDGLHLFTVEPYGSGRYAVDARMARGIAVLASMAPEMFSTLCAIADGKGPPVEIAGAILKRREFCARIGEDGRLATA